uniref:Uncharacterized protein n=1 Tax=Meleagris gallopavo TaxID=9103 RepID=A0A803YL83_MELGA
TVVFPNFTKAEPSAVVIEPEERKCCLVKSVLFHSKVKDDYVFECEVGNQLQKTKLTIFQSLGNPLYYGKIQTLKGDDESDSLLVPPHSSLKMFFTFLHFRFLIGSKTDAERVVNQYHELVKSEAKCPVKMFHNSGGSINLSHLSPGKEMEQPESISGSVQSSVLGKGVKHRPPPIKLPSSSGSSSSGNIFSPQQSSGHLKSPTPPPPPPSSKPPGLSRKQSMDLNQVSMLSPAAMSPASSSQSESRPKFSIKS